MKSNFSAEDIAARLNLDTITVRTRLRELGFIKRKIGSYFQYALDRAQMELVIRDFNIRREKRFKFTKQESAYKKRELKRITKISMWSIYKYLKKMNISNGELITMDLNVLAEKLIIMRRNNLERNQKETKIMVQDIEKKQRAKLNLEKLRKQFNKKNFI